MIASPFEAQVMEQARRSRDARFDGLFFVAVRTTGIYCRPVCPAPTAKAENVDYYADAAAASAAGFRPCLRCRPELSPPSGHWQPSEQLLRQALHCMDDALGDGGGLDGLAQRVGLSARQLRRVFAQQLGASPIQVWSTRRLLFARQLLDETELPITEVALAAGFQSLRRFNAAFKSACGCAPRDVRRRPRTASAEGLVLRLAYRPPYAFKEILQFFEARAVPGVERVYQQGYERVFGAPQAPGWLRVEAWPGEHALRLTLRGAAAGELRDLVRRVRRMFDLDADPRAIAAVLAEDPLFTDSLAETPGLRLPGAWDLFELGLRAVLGQQVSVVAARTLAGRLFQRHGEVLSTPLVAPLNLLPPTPQALCELSVSDTGLPQRRAATLRALAELARAGRLNPQPGESPAQTVAGWLAVPGIGPWTASYMLLRGLGHPDAFPAADLVLRKVSGLDTAALEARAEAWRPWRGYAVMHLWRRAAKPDFS